MTTLQDSSGNTSSKRLAGFITGGIGLVMGIIVFFYAVFKAKVPDSNTAIEVFKTMLYVSGALLGIGVVEKFGKK
jgi:hypothetical protein